MAELADAQDLGSCVFIRRVGSTPSLGTAFGWRFPAKQDLALP